MLGNRTGGLKAAKNHGLSYGALCKWARDNIEIKAWGE